MALVTNGSALRIAVAHNRYQLPGGEDQVFEREVALLQAAGHVVMSYEVHNDAVASMSSFGVAARYVWSPTTYRTLRARFASFRPHVVHVHNTLPLISPAIFVAARRSGAAVVQTLHNYRMVCPSATLFRDGRPCELCVSQRLALSGVRHACYRNSRSATAVVAGSTFIHRTLGTYARNVDRFIALTEFARMTLSKGGVPAEKLVVKPNFTEPTEATRREIGGAALFVGRLSEEKGIRTLLDAWRRHPDLPPLRIVGDGPLRSLVGSEAAQDASITALGAVPQDRVHVEMRSAAVLVFPSTCYEGFPMTIVEAFANGLPVVGSRIGSVAEIVTNGEVGLTFTPGDADELAERVRRLSTDRALNAQLGTAALRRYEERFTPEANLKQLLRIYQEAIEHRSVHRRR